MRATHRAASFSYQLNEETGSECNINKKEEEIRLGRREIRQNHGTVATHGYYKQQICLQSTFVQSNFGADIIRKTLNTYHFVPKSYSVL